MEPTLEQIGRLAVRYVRALQEQAAGQLPEVDAQEAWEDLYAEVERYGAKVDPSGGGECSR